MSGPKQVIHKYPLKDKELQTLALPLRVIPRSVAVQDGVLCLWAQHEVGLPHSQDREIRIVGTGFPFSDGELPGYEYIGTAQDGAFVWHVSIKAIYE